MPPVKRKTKTPGRKDKVIRPIINSASPESALPRSTSCWDANGKPVANLDEAAYKLGLLKEQAMIRIGELISVKGWNQKTAGENLTVAQPRISDLIRGRHEKFSLDTLIAWLFKLEQSVTIQFEASEKFSFKTRTDGNETIEFYTRVIMLDPSDSTYYHRRGDAYLELNQYDLAIGDYSRCIELEPSRLGPRNNRALAYLKSGQLRACIQDSEKLIELQPLYGGAYCHRAGAYEQMEKFDLALQDYSKQIELEFDRPGPYWNRASLYKRLGDFKKAQSDLKKILELNPAAMYAQEALDVLPNE